MELPTTILTRPPELDECSKNILLVDDEPHVLAVGKAVLIGQGFHVVCASSGEQAVDLLRHAVQQQNCYSATLLDLTMPGGPSGFETLEVLRSIAPQMPVIDCSGYFQDDARELCQAIGFYDIIRKPYNFDVLGGCVRRAVNGLPAEDVSAKQEQVLVTV